MKLVNRVMRLWWSRRETAQPSLEAIAGRRIMLRSGAALAVTAVTPWLSAQAGPRSATRTKLLVALTEAEHEVRELKKEVRDVRNLQIKACANAHTFNGEMHVLHRQINDLVGGHAEARAKILAWLNLCNEAVYEGQLTLEDARSLNFELQQLNCYLSRLACSLQGLACAIDKGLKTALFVGILIGLGLSFAFTGAAGVHPVTSVSIH